jgi:hypothetical protein
LILACSHRLDYPQEAIQWLSSYAPELPLAVATDTWWDGARRTGLGGLTHLTLPWHRWWDGWSDWLDATSSDWFGPCVLPATCGMERRAAKAEVIQVRTPRRGAVVANCRQTAEAWCLVARQAGADVDWWSAAGWQALIGGEAGTATAAVDAAVDWLLWDDSCLNTAGGATDGFAERGDCALTDCLGFIQQARKLLPQAQIFCGCSIPRWADWEQMQRRGANELLSKPNTGRGLQRLLEIQ